MAQPALVGQSRLIIDASRLHSLDTPRSVGLLQTGGQHVAETSTWQYTQHSQEMGIHAAGGIRTHNLSKRAASSDHDLDREATGTSDYS